MLFGEDDPVLDMAFCFAGKESHLGFEGGKGKGDQRVGGKGGGVRGQWLSMERLRSSLIIVLHPC